MGRFLRVARDEDGEPTALETAIVRYVPEDEEKELIVDLIAVVHVGEAGYYTDLNKRFEQYDALLYELVAPEGVQIDKGARDNAMMNLLKRTLRLDSQIERIDYTKENFVHADLTPEQMGQKLRERGEDGWTLGLNIIADMMRQQSAREQRRRDEPRRPAPDIGLGTLLFDPKGPLKLKRVMADQFDDLGEDGGEAHAGEQIEVEIGRHRDQRRVDPRLVTRGATDLHEGHGIVICAGPDVETTGHVRLRSGTSAPV
jgi:hypothetical protein